MTNDKLNKLRQEIDLVDNELLDLLHKRLAVMQQIGDVKKELHMPIRDQERENEKLSVVQEQARKLYIPETLVRQIWKLFFEISEEIEK